MSWLNNIAGRAAFGFAVVWGVTACAIVGSVLLSRDASNVLETTLVSHSDDLMHAAHAQVAAERMVAIGRGYLLTNDRSFLGRANEAELELNVALHSLDRGDARPAERELLQAVKRSAAQYRQLLDQTLEIKPATTESEGPGRAIRERLLPAREDLGAKLGNLVAHKQNLQVVARQHASRSSSRTVEVTTGVGAFALLLSALLAWVFTRRLTEISRLERTSAQQATRALLAQEELLGVVAHDLRSPLTAISLRAASMVQSHLDDHTSRAAMTIQSICTGMERLIQSLLDAASVEAGLLSVQVTRLPIQEILVSTIETFALAAQQRAVQLEGEALPAQFDVWADRGRIHQVLSNLVGNALKFTPAGGAIKVRARQQSGSVRFEVEDTGSGIVAEHVPHVFERYWKSDARSERGTGLGLYIAKGIIEGHGGRIWVKSSPGTGSSFQFELPNPSVREREPESSPIVPQPAAPIVPALGIDQKTTGCGVAFGRPAG